MLENENESDIGFAQNEYFQQQRAKSEVGKMTQRKLTSDELQVVMETRSRVRQLIAFADTGIYWQLVLSNLNAMATHSTTDGKPYVDPEPPIPDNYRKAVAGDEGREDARWWDKRSGRYRDTGKWSAGVPFDPEGHIVPADRTPTDEDAKSRPEVMVRNLDDCKWQKYTLLAVFESRPETRFMCLYGNGSTYATWKQCRHLYPGE